MKIACGLALAVGIRALKPQAIYYSDKDNQRFENWNALRAPLRPYFLRSFMRPSRVRKPESRSFLAMALMASLPSTSPPDGRPNMAFKARAIPWLAAPACPVMPPPEIVM